MFFAAGAHAAHPGFIFDLFYFENVKIKSGRAAQPARQKNMPGKNNPKLNNIMCIIVKPAKVLR
jgi:hypothetical protein